MKPIPSSMFLMGILGFIISVYLTTSGLIDVSWGFAFCLAFLIMFISAVISITPSDDIDYKLSMDEDNEKEVMGKTSGKESRKEIKKAPKIKNRKK